MKTLEQHDIDKREIHKIYESRNMVMKNNIECPKCGKELVDSCPSETLMSSPPKKNIHCLKCGFTGHRLV